MIEGAGNWGQEKTENWLSIRANRWGVEVPRGVHESLSFVRGATFDNLADIPGMYSLIYRIGSVGGVYMFGDDDPETGMADAIYWGAGQLVGGMIRYAIDDPAAAIGGIIGPSIAKPAIDIGMPKLEGHLRTSGREYISYDSMTSENIVKMEGDVLRSDIKFPTGYPTEQVNVKQGMDLFDGAKEMYPNKEIIRDDTVVGIHVHETPFEVQSKRINWDPLGEGMKITSQGKSKGSGFFLGHNVSPRFSRMTTPELVNLMPGAALESLVQNKDKPTVVFVETAGFKRLPEEVRGDKSKANQYIRMESDPNYILTTEKFERMAGSGSPNVEIEGVLPGGTILEKAEGQYYTKFHRPVTILGQREIFGHKLQHTVRVPIDYYRNTGEFATFTRDRGTAIVDTDDGILMVQERNGLWGLPGGGIDIGETASMAAMRELMEETGLRGKVTEHLFEFADEEYKRAYEGGLYRNQHHVFAVDAIGEINLSNEVKNYMHYQQGMDIPMATATKTILNQYLGINEVFENNLRINDQAITIDTQSMEMTPIADSFEQEFMKQMDVEIEIDKDYDTSSTKSNEKYYTPEDEYYRMVSPEVAKYSTAMATEYDYKGDAEYYKMISPEVAKYSTGLATEYNYNSDTEYYGGKSRKNEQYKENYIPTDYYDLPLESFAPVEEKRRRREAESFVEGFMIDTRKRRRQNRGVNPIAELETFFGGF
jgi:ADP-ribose pyrophosphatase